MIIHSVCPHSPGIRQEMFDIDIVYLTMRERQRERESSLNWIFVNIIFQHMVNIEYENQILQQPQIMYFQIETMFQFNCFTVAVFSSCDVAIFLVYRSDKKREKYFRESKFFDLFQYILSEIITFCLANVS